MSQIYVPGARRHLARQAQAAMQQAAQERARANQLYATLAAILIEQGGTVRVPRATLALVDTDVPINAHTDGDEVVVSYAKSSAVDCGLPQNDADLGESGADRSDPANDPGSASKDCL